MNNDDKPRPYSRAVDCREDAIDREWSLRMIALCEAAGVDPATLEDGPEALHDAIVSLRADLIAANEDCDKLREQLREALDLQERMAEERVAALRGAESQGRLL